MNKQTATRLLHTHLHQHGVLATANVERCVFEDPFRFNAIQFLLSQGLTQQPIRKQCHKLLGLLVRVAGKTFNAMNTGTVTKEIVTTAVSRSALAKALALTDPEHSQQLIEGLTAHLTQWPTAAAADEYHKRVIEVLELVTQALCCVNNDTDWSNA